MVGLAGVIVARMNTLIWRLFVCFLFLKALGHLHL